MSILVNQDTRVICQGITGKAGAFHTKGCLDYGTEHGRRRHARQRRARRSRACRCSTRSAEAVEKTGANATMIFVPAAFTADAILEAVDAGHRR